MASASGAFGVERVVEQDNGSLGFNLGYILRPELRRQRMPLPSLADSTVLRIHRLLSRRIHTIQNSRQWCCRFRREPDSTIGTLDAIKVLNPLNE